MTRLLGMPKTGNSVIDAGDVFRIDILRWIIVAVAVSLLHLAVALVVLASTDHQGGIVMATAYLYSMPFVMYCLILLGAVGARGSLDVWTWGFALLTILTDYQLLKTVSIADLIFPNGALTPMLVLSALLALGRCVEYAYVRYGVGPDEPKMTRGAFAFYGLSLLMAWLLISSIPFALIEKLMH